MATLDWGYDRYVRAYRSLAALGRIDPGLLWRELWRLRNGRVRGGFATVVLGLLHAGPSANGSERTRLQTVADELFAPGREDENLPDSELETRWRQALS